MSTEDVAALFERVKALPPSDRLRLAAGLLDARKPDLALSIIRRVEGELSLALTLARVGGKAGAP